MVIDFDALYLNTRPSAGVTDLDDALRGGAGSAPGVAPPLFGISQHETWHDARHDPGAIIRMAQKAPRHVWRVVVIGPSGFEALDIQGAENKNELELMKMLYANMWRTRDHININYVVFTFENAVLFLASSTTHTRTLMNVIDGINRTYGHDTIDVAVDVRTMYYHQLQAAMEKAHSWQCDVVMVNELAKDIERSLHLMQDVNIHLKCHGSDNSEAGIAIMDGITSDAIISTNICDLSSGGNGSVFDRVVNASIKSSDGLQEPLRTLIRGRIEKVRTTYRTPLEMIV
jgi:hypothetical protein